MSSMSESRAICAGEVGELLSGLLPPLVEEESVTSQWLTWGASWLGSCSFLSAAVGCGSRSPAARWLRGLGVVGMTAATTVFVASRYLIAPVEREGAGEYLELAGRITAVESEEVASDELLSSLATIACARWR